MSVIPINASILLSRYHVARYIWRGDDDEEVVETLLADLISHLERMGLETLEANENDAIREDAQDRTDRYNCAIEKAARYLPFIKHGPLTVGLHWLVDRKSASHAYMYFIERNFLDGDSFHLNREYYLERLKTSLVSHGIEFFQEMQYWKGQNYCDSCIHPESLHSSWDDFHSIYLTEFIPMEIE